MRDFEIEENWPVLVAIAEGQSFETLVKVHPRLTREQYADYTKFVRSCQRQRGKAWKRWTPEDKAKLRKLFRDGALVPQIAFFLGRSTNAVRIRLRQMGLLPRHQNTRMQRSPS